MQVSSSNGLQNRYFSGTGSIGGIHLPDFNDKYVFSKKKSGTSEEEYRKQIREQAYAPCMLLCNRKQEIDRQHHTIPNQRSQRPQDKHYGNVHNRLFRHG